MSKKGKQPLTGKTRLRTRRVFSDTFKKQKVKEIANGLISVSELSRLYSVSVQSIYRWLHKFSKDHQKGTIQVVQMQSESKKTIRLLEQVAKLERIIGQKQLEIDYLNKLVEISSEELKVDLKKNFDTKSSTTSTDCSKQVDSK